MEIRERHLTAREGRKEEIGFEGTIALVKALDCWFQRQALNSQQLLHHVPIIRVPHCTTSHFLLRKMDWSAYTLTQGKTH